jgi:cysteinyl-tRNA synthetase
MTLRVYNTLSQQKELFQTVRPGKVGMYLCGPTVYKSPHIGHMVGPVIFDTIKRYLTFKGFEVTWVVNITDVDDKLIDAASRLGTTVKELAEKHTAEYLECLQSLGVTSIDHFPRATGHISEIIELCQTLISKGHAYAAEGNVWFDVAKDPDYGKLSHRQVEEQEAGTRGTETAGKRGPADFGLWKAAKPGEISWDSPWGKGRPGWHIECSAMSMKILGPTFDIHGGGMDLMFPHHENELAQSESATGQAFTRYWLHNGLTKFNTKKIAGSDMWTKEGAEALALVAAKKLIADHGADVLRYLLLSSHYRRPIDFSETTISDTKKALGTFARLFERIDRLIALLPPPPAPPDGGPPAPRMIDDMDRASSALLEGEHAPFAKAVLGLKMKFLEMMDDDFNTAGAIAALHEMAGEINGFVERNDVEKSKSPELISAGASATKTLRNLGGVIGLFQKPAAPPTAVAAADQGLAAKLMELFIRMRADARKNKNFALADDIRNGLTAIGVTLEDGSEGTRWRKD